MGSRTKRVVLAFVGFVLLLGLGGTVYAAAQKADFTLAVSPSSATIAAGATTSYAVTVTGSNGFKSPVTLSVTGLPVGASATLSPNPNTTTTSQVTVQAGTSTPVGSYSLTVTGVSGALTHTATATLTVTAPASRFSLGASPTTISTPAGTVATYAIAIARTNFPGPIAFAVSGTPSNASATFTPASTSGTSTSLQVSTSSATTLGAYTLTITGSSGSTSARTVVQLTVSAAQGGRPFTITGTADRTLAPGVTGVLNLTLTNPNNQALDVTNLTVTISSTGKAGCSVSGNYGVVQFSGVYPLTVPANSSRTLSQLTSAATYPKIVMNDLATNQDACKGAVLSLSYAGTGSGG